MADSLWLSDFPDNKDRDAFDQWLEDRSNRFADLIAREIKRITTNAYEAFIKSVDETTVTASGDINSIDSVIPEWNLVVQGEIMDEINQTYLTGSVSAYTVASGVNSIPAAFSSQWAQVINQQAVAYALTANNRIKDVGKTLWNDMRKRVSKTIATGSTTEQLKADIEALTNFSEYRADTIARTEIASAYINGNYQGDVALGEYGPVEKVWVASGDARTRATHLAAQTASEANPVPFSQPFTVGGVEMMYPHSPGAPAKEVVNCRCHYESYYVGDTRPDGSIVQIGDVKVTSPIQGQPLQQEQVITQPVQATPSLPAGENFSSQVDLPETSSSKVRQRNEMVAEMLSLLDNLHRLPKANTRQVKIRYTSTKGNKGGHYNPGTRGPKPRRVRGQSYAVWSERVNEYNARELQGEILLTESGGLDGQAFSLIHELGHRFDQDGAVSGFRNGYRSIRAAKNSEVNNLQSKYGKDWWDHLDEITDVEQRELLTLGKITRELESPRQYVAKAPASYSEYFFSIHEVWARAYSQWVAEVTQHPRLLAGLEPHLGKYQYSREEFELLRPHVEAVLKARGVM